MLSDSLFELIDNLWDDITKYNNQPYEYSHIHKKELLNTLAHMYYTAYKVSDPRFNKHLSFCLKLAVEEWDRRFPSK